MISIRSFVAAAAGLVCVAAASGLTAAAAHATPKVMCVYATENGASGDVSALKCKNPEDGMRLARAEWASAFSLTTVTGESIAQIADDPTAPDGISELWQVNPSLVSFADIKRELMRYEGYTNVFYVSTGCSCDGSVMYVAGNFETPSKAKH